MLKNANSLRNAAILVVAAASVSLPMISVAQAQSAGVRPPWEVNQCRVHDELARRCYTFHSDSTWREGLSDYHGSNGG